MNTLFKTVIRTVGMLGLVCIIGCSSQKNTSNSDYLRLNDTSNGMMAEVESGFVMGLNGFLYYADRDNMNTWVVVCNKPNCFHEDSQCNAYIPSNSPYITQKGNHIYGIRYDVVLNEMYIYEIQMDGSGEKKVYKLPKIDTLQVSGFLNTLFSDQIVVNYNYINEYGVNQEHFIALREDEDGNMITQTLYEESDVSGNLINGNLYFNMRGDDIILTTLFAERNESFLNIPYRVGETGFERLNIPIPSESMVRGYLSGVFFIYYEKNEGFYKINLDTGEKELIAENQLENARGSIFSEEYMIENTTTEGSNESALKFYNGEEWVDVTLPEQLKNSKLKIFPVGIGTDRVFVWNVVEKTYLLDSGKIETDEFSEWYYFMLEDENPELILIGEIPKSNLEYIDVSMEETESSTEENIETFEEVIIFDTDRCFLKITDHYVDDKNRYCVDYYYENRDKADFLFVSYATINGVQCNIWQGARVASDSNKTGTLYFEQSYMDFYRISDLYTIDEYTDIGIGFAIQEAKTLEVLEDTIYHIYPKGEENAIAYTRERQTEDLVIVDNEYVSVIVTGYEKSLITNDTIHVYIKNKTDGYVKFYIEDASANDIEISREVDGLYNMMVSPGSCSICPITLFDGVTNLGEGEPNAKFFDSNGITNIEEIGMQLRIYPSNEHLDVLGEDYFNEWITLNP